MDFRDSPTARPWRALYPSVRSLAGVYSVMSVPFSAEQFFGVFAAYNQAIWPFQILLVGAAVAAVAAAVWGGERAGPWIGGFLAALWAWTGIAYHLLHFLEINPVASFFGALFVLQGLAFFWWSVAWRRPTFEPAADAYGVAGGMILLYALLLYPLLGRLVGHGIVASPTFGTPCPVVIYTFGLLLLARRVPAWLLIIPVIWAIIGSSAVLAFGVPQDAGLVVAALVAVPMLVYRRRNETARASGGPRCVGFSSH